MAVSEITTATNRESKGFLGSRMFAVYGMDADAGTIPKGAIVTLDATGYAVNGTDAVNHVFVGIAVETKTADATGSDGDTEIKVDCTPGVWWKFGHNTGDLNATCVGTVMHLENNNAVDDGTAATKDVRVGTIAKYIDADECWVRVDFHDPIGDSS